MRLWNLNSFADLQQQVVQESTHCEFGRIEGRGTLRRSSSVKIAFQVAALSVASLAVTVVGSPSNNRYVATGTAIVADNTEHGKPPLSAIFSDRFTADWTAEHEQDLLVKMAGNKGKQNLDDEMLGFVEGSQQEAVDSKGPGLSKGDLLALLRRKV